MSRSVEKITLKVKLTGHEPWHSFTLPAAWSSVKVLEAIVDGMVAQGHFAELCMVTQETEIYRGPLELIEDADEAPTTEVPMIAGAHWSRPTLEDELLGGKGD